MSVKIHCIPGQLPPFWENRRAIFFANLLSLFFGNSGETHALKREVGRIPSYGGRLLPIINTLFQGEHNLLVVDQAPNEALADYFMHSLGLTLPDVEVLPFADYQTFVSHLREQTAYDHGAMEHISIHPAEWVDGFVTDQWIADLAQGLGKSTISSIAGSRRGNNKLLLHRFLKEQGLPVFETLEADSKADVPAAFAELRKQGFRRAVAKAPIGASGVGLEAIHSECDIPGLPDFLFEQGPCMIQGWLEPGRNGILDVFSPSIQLFVSHEDVYLYDLTEQILSERAIHQGNQAPPPYQGEHPEVADLLFDQARVVGQWLHDQDYRGTASIDFVLQRRQDEWEAMVCEVNARVTGATYPAVLARRFLPGGSWVMRNLLLEQAMKGEEILEAMRNEGCLYEPGRPSGIIPINFNLNSQHEIDKGQFLFVARDAGGCWGQMKEIEEALPLQWRLDRD